ncbi:hypothetical protein SEA_STARBOW_254 [Streptomyces phage Starbow]|uniref:Uncharacterized protein n=2 Tax=Streptomyces virus Karimac TaxID=2846401 RepID=A0A890UTP6_9CAUD|nr:hypothetical protein SEA_STARBOW_254 [Streptomyces phage Starbow]QGH74456.1 hypothetical protein SEA_WIPEOUT_249 [Streptomyces phage Wipeout]QRI45896.1 hypothetical protein SEA_BATTUTA_255 [Streptomyces phage Battuta]
MIQHFKGNECWRNWPGDIWPGAWSPIVKQVDTMKQTI